MLSGLSLESKHIAPLTVLYQSDVTAYHQDRTPRHATLIHVCTGNGKSMGMGTDREACAWAQAWTHGPTRRTQPIPTHTHTTTTGPGPGPNRQAGRLRGRLGGKVEVRVGKDGEAKGGAVGGDEGPAG